MLGEGCPDPYGVLGEVFMPNAVRMRSLLKSMAPTVPFYLTQSLVLHQMQRTVESVTSRSGFLEFLKIFRARTN